MTQQQNNPSTTASQPLRFRDTAPAASSTTGTSSVPHKILLVDDDREVHTLTRLVLQGYSFDKRGLDFISAYSAAEAKELIARHPDTALVLLDVVMEYDEAGLDVVRHIRDILGNSLVRIVLRTGQPGQAPEREVILNYDINDYKEKTELTAQKLFTMVTTSLRSYRDLKTLEENRKGMRKVIEAAARLFEPRSFQALSEAILRQLCFLLDTPDGADSRNFVARARSEEELLTLATGAALQQVGGENILPHIEADVLELLLDAVHNRRSQFGRDQYAGYYETKNGERHVAYFKSARPISDTDQQTLTMFGANVTLALDNLYLNQELLDTQRQIICMLGEVVEHRSRETGNHVRRMTELSCMLGLHCGMSAEELELLEMAAPLHDVGKIGVPDHILHKPGRLTDEEMATMRTHTTIGRDILSGSPRPVFQEAARIAIQHHERWDGSGYPNGLKGEEISLSGRITALADVVDALGHKRCYKDAWSKERILELVQRESGKHFDPRVVAVFLDHIADYDAISAAFPANSEE